MPITVPDFRKLVATGDVRDIVDSLIMSGDSAHVTSADKTLIGEELKARFNIRGDDIDVYIVGSAKLGFALTEKKEKGALLPRYRPFGVESDIDVAVVSRTLFEAVWHELSVYGHTKDPFPWDARGLGPYLVYGWLRPDRFPKDRSLRMCDGWWETFDRLSADARFKRHLVRGALFFDRSFVVRYQRRAVRDCKAQEALAR